MNFRNYLTDKSASVGITFGAWCVILLFFGAFRTSAEEIVIISVIYFLAAFGRLLYEYFRKRRFYNDLVARSGQLDQKYLLSEMLETPDFFEGKLIHEALREACASMCEQVADYRRVSEEFREYIELWVHEVKLPLASLMLMSHNNPATDERYTEQLHRIDGYIENVLFYARSENAEKDYLIKEVSLQRALVNTALRCRSELLQHRVNLRSEIPDVNVTTDGKWLEYILGQLMGNSLKYLSPDREPEICVYTEIFPDKIILHFRDNGIGIPAADLPRIFDKSFTGENGRIYAKSTGMGLYIVQNLCLRLGHSIRAESVQGQFTDIVITFGRDTLTRIE